MQTVLLGLCDGHIGPGDPIDWHVNKVGASPDWLEGFDPFIPPCRLCGDLTSLVIQVYCPLEGSSYHRIIHVFACTQKSCWNKPESWTALRSQQVDSSLQSVSEKKSDPMFDTSWSDDEWGACDDDPMAAVHVSTSVSFNSLASSSDGDSQRYPVADPQSTHCDDIPVPTPEDEGINSCLADMCVDDNDEMTPQPQVFSLRSMCLSQLAHQPIKDIIEHSPGSDNTQKHSSPFDSWYLSVIEEPSAESDNFDHEKKLLAEYMRHEGVEVSDMVSSHLCKAGAGGVEGYERGQAAHGDRVFHKFLKRISRYPSQVIRYSYGGEPQPLTSSPLVPTPCSQCGAQTLFEMQILPSLLPFLSVESNSTRLEFGTASVYTCSKSCWVEGATRPVSEQVLLQTDPDQHRFQSSR